MPEFEGSYKVVEIGHKTKVKSDVKPFIKGAKVASWYYAIQYRGEDGKPACMLMTEAAFTGGKTVKVSSDLSDPNLGKVEKKGIKATIWLYDEEEDIVCQYEFYTNEIKRAMERAAKYPHLCTEVQAPKKGFFARLFSK